MSVRDARVYTCKHVLYTISYRVLVYKLHDRRIPKVGDGVGVDVGPMKFQLNGTSAGRRLPKVERIFELDEIKNRRKRLSELETKVVISTCIPTPTANFIIP